MRRKTKGVSQKEMKKKKKKTKKANWKETRRSCKNKKERKGVFEKKKVFSKKKKRVKMRKVDKESEHQEGTYTERKHEKSQDEEKKKRGTQG